VINNGGRDTPHLVDVGRTEGAPGLCLVWKLAVPMRAISSSLVGGGLSSVGWVINVTVEDDYARMDPADHLAEIADHLGLTGPGIAMMTAVNVAAWVSASHEQASDAVCVLCPVDGPADLFGGPRSTWGSRLARATYDAITDGLLRQRSSGHP
jgi:adenosylcobinamide amidohydrolase